MNATEQAKQLALYNLNDVLVIEPTLETKMRLKNQRILCRTENGSLKIAVETLPPIEGNEALPRIPIISINPDLELFFVVKFKYPDFTNYTNLNFNSNELLLFTNEKTDHQLTIPEIQTEPLADSDNAYITNDFFMNATTQSEILKNIAPRELFGSIGIIRIKMINPDDLAKSIIINSNSIYNPARRFVVQFANKELYWQYKKSGDNSTYRTITKQPLAKHGFISINSETGLTPPLEILSGMKLPNPLVFNPEKILVDDVEELSTVIYI